MTKTIKRTLQIPQPPEKVWQAITQRDTLAEWMFPNDIEPRPGHQFTFQVPPNPETNFQGLTLHCEVLECEAPRHLRVYRLRQVGARAAVNPNVA